MKLPPPCYLWATYTWLCFASLDQGIWFAAGKGNLFAVCADLIQKSPTSGSPFPPEISCESCTGSQKTIGIPTNTTAYPSLFEVLFWSLRPQSKIHFPAGICHHKMIDATWTRRGICCLRICRASKMAWTWYRQQLLQSFQCVSK